MTEIDLLKQVVHKHLKTITLSSEEEKKIQTRDQFRSAYRVWSGFVKFIRSQVQLKHRMVDTKLIGWFYQQDNSVKYLPSEEFYEAAKFKNK